MIRKTKYLYTLVTLLAMMLSGCRSGKYAADPDPVTKNAVVGFDSYFNDTIPLNDGQNGTNLIVRMEFDEPANVLTLTVRGTRKVFIFRDDSYYKNIFHKTFLGRRVLVPGNLSYHVLVQPGSKMYIAKKVTRHFTKPKRDYILRNWLGGFSDELSIIPPSVATNQEPEAALISDSIVQRFKVDSTAISCNLILENFFSLRKLQSNKPARYNITNERNVSTTYNIKLRRDACFGLEAKLDSSLQKLYDVTNAYYNLMRALNKGTVQTKEARQIFYQHRQYLLQRYPRQDASCQCSQIQSNYTAYNTYVDSISRATCAFVPPVDPSALKVTKTGVPAETILDVARKLDDTVARYVQATDEAEQHDVTVSGAVIIKSMLLLVKEQGLVGKDQHAAFAEFKRAKAYFDTIVWSHEEGIHDAIHHIISK